MLHLYFKAKLNYLIFLIYTPAEILFKNEVKLLREKSAKNVLLIEASEVFLYVVGRVSRVCAAHR